MDALASDSSATTAFMVDVLLDNEQLRTFAADMYSADPDCPYTEAEIECIRRGTVPAALHRKITREFSTKMPMVLPMVTNMLQGGGGGGLQALLAGLGAPEPPK